MNLNAYKNLEQKIKHRLLIIDADNKMLCDFKTYLETNGYEVTATTNIEAARRAFKDNRYDLVFYDLKMTKNKNLSLIESFHSQRPNIPIIILSALGQINEVIEAISLGASDYLMKPLSSFEDCHAIIKITLLNNNHQSSHLSIENEAEQARLELEMNLKLLMSDHKAEIQTQLQMLPEPKMMIGDYLFQHTIIRSKSPGSDFLDFFEIDKRYIGFYIADISGSKNESPLITMTLKSMINQPLRAFRQNTDDTIINPSSLLEHLNQEMIAASIGKYITLFYAVIDKTENTLTVSLGGHFPRPVMLNNSDRITFKEDSFPIGLFKWAEYEQQSIALKSPFTLGMFSDGLLKVLDDKSTKNTREKLTKFCSSHHVSIPGLVKQLQLSAKHPPLEDISLFLVQKA